MSGEKRSYSFLKTFFLCCCLLAVMVLALGRVSSAQAANTVTITGLMDGDLPGGLPKALEIYVSGTVDLSTYSLERSANGAAFANTSALSGTYTDEFVYIIYSTSDNQTAFTNVFGTSGDFANVILSGILNGNGDDGFRILDSSSNVVDQVWTENTSDSYKDSYWYRNNSTGPDGGWVPANWTTPGNGALDGLDAAGHAAAVPFGTYQNGAVGPTPTPSPSMPQLLLTEIVVTPTGGEFVEIYNPTGSAVDLSDVYLTDGTFAGGSTYYYNIVTGSNAGGGGFGDFNARFPDGASIAPGEYQTIAMAGATAFFAEFGVNPTYELIATDATVDDMREATAGSINGQGGLSNDGEVVVLYYWDGTTDIVTDLDYVVWGDKVEAVDKTGVSTDGPDAGSDATAYLNDTAIGSQDVISTGGHPDGSSWQRDDLTEGTETKSGGNGADGHDETSENLSTTWCESGTVTPNAASVCPAGADPIVINEISADPDATNGDANGDGTVNTSQDEFVEIVNNTGSDLDISGWTLADGNSVRHTFPANTVIPDQCAVVVFSGGTPTGTFGNATVQTASGGQLGLNNGGDTVTLNDGTTDRAAYTYGSEGGDNQSLTRDPDITGTDPLVKHATATGSGGALFSPGTQISGAAFSGCSAPPPVGTVKIHEVQGSGDSVTSPGSTVTVEAIVVGVFDELGGFFIQEEDADVDADPSTSEGIFVYCGSCSVAVGDKVEVTGVEEEFFDMSQIDVTGGGSINVLSSNNTLPTPATISLPISLSATNVSAAETELNAFYEPYEGMLVTFTGDLTVAEYFELARYGQVVLSDGRIEQFTNANAPSAAGYTQHLIDKMAKTIILDDLNNRQNDPLDFGNPANDTPVFHPVPGFSVSNYFRGGDTITDLTGVLHWSFAGQTGTDAWRIRPVTESYSYDFTPANARPSVPNVGGNVKVASFNVLNYFNGNGSGGGFPTSRGADSSAEFDRQTDKIVAAIIEMDADIIGLMEIENDFADGNNSAIADLVDALNAVAGSGTYAYADPGGNVGTDEIAVGIIYKPGTVTLAGSVATLTDAGFTPSKNRPAMAATFDSVLYGERFTVVVNHLKSKGSGCGGGDDDTTTGQGNCNGTRTSAANYMVNTWLPTDPTGSGDPDFLIIGDLNAYAMEDPITAIKNAGYTDLLDSYSGGNAYGYVFDGEVGYLDHAMSSSSLTPQINDAAIWNINADEVNLLDYNDGILDSGEQNYERKPTATTLYAPDQFRSSDHDPVLVGINLTTNTAISLSSAEAGGVINSGIILLMVTLLTLATLFLVARRGRQTQA